MSLATSYEITSSDPSRLLFIYQGPSPVCYAHSAYRVLPGRGEVALGGLGRREGGAPAWRGEPSWAASLCAAL